MNRGRILKLLKLELDPGGAIIKVFIVTFFRKCGLEATSPSYKAMRRVFHTFSKPPVNLRSYSIFGEDKVLKMYLPETSGKYLDIGAGDPKYGSNTYFLYQLGWSGICVEPIRRNHQKHKKLRPKDIQIQACIAGKISAEKIEFYEYIAHEFSTDSPQRVEELTNSGIFYNDSYSVKAVSLMQLNLVAKPKNPFLLDIDVEGNEYEILIGNDWDSFSPRVISVEEWMSPIYKESTIRNLLESKGYKLVSRCFITSIYVHVDYLNEITSKNQVQSPWFTS